MRGMKQVDLLPAQIKRDANLFADRVLLHRFGNGAEVRAEFLRQGRVASAAEDNVLRLRVEPRQMPQQVAQVRPDAVVPDLAGINRDSQDTGFYRGSCPFTRR